MVRQIFGFSKKLSKSKREPERQRDNKGSEDNNDSEPSGNDSVRSHDVNEATAYDDRSSKVVSSLGSSVFSKSKLTYSTGGTSSNISGSRNSKRHMTDISERCDGSSADVGKPLRVVNLEKFNLLNPVFEDEGNTEGDSTVDDTSNTNASFTTYAGNASSDTASRSLGSLEQLNSELCILEDNLVTLMDDIHQNVTNISKAVIQAIEYFKKFLPHSTDRLPFKVTFDRFPSLRCITKIVLHFSDNLLSSEVFSNSRSILLRRYLHFLKKLNIVISDEAGSGSGILPCLSNFCIDSEQNLPNIENIEKIIEEISKSDPGSISDQDGAFVAPIMRGLSRKVGILTVMFGIPNPQQEHFDIVKALYTLFPDVHFFCAKDYIKPCADILQSHIPTPMESHLSAPEKTMSFHFEPPYRLAVDAERPPISMSLSSDNSSKMTGTLGGYLFPQIEKGSKLSQFAGASFAITCSHVVLSESHDYPYVSIPSKVLQTAYKNTLLEEARRYPKHSKEESAFIDESSRIENNIKWQEENKFGQVVWGERSIINQKLSDFAIIKVNSKYKCENCLGLGLSSVPDPTLKFQNLFIKEKILKLKSGMRVFKIGASTNYTSGEVNAAKLVHWADGKLQSSEFVVSSPLPLFASAGDSGSWILTKLENQLGLGVVGMLHSYDGEQRQFGLFSPIGDILERLHDVTGVLWDIDPQIE
ncbi:hypothetical protein HG535_0B04770 [Zygotorulaspora mrakii]|uniref:SPS-sensor serine protease component SSY5 n=1 Tax=Zygotorulaspora mrakii TaxID=42260 RepID=A0A7H9AYF1_ZYGMR|nr:uncharacterized protein HG535_0B04770 [Zygotorulaspora mrakii]QLG71435.1 hypothetical protein HG535_0B04770 [Zygotorulaspora mrakii]